jgi:hypothetical protein
MITTVGKKPIGKNYRLTIGKNHSQVGKAAFLIVMWYTFMMSEIS